MLTRQRKETIDATLTIKGQGETVKFNITFNNIKTSEIEKETQLPDFSVAALLLKMIHSWECEYDLSLEGLKELEDDRPGILFGIIEGYHQARRVERSKN